MKEPVKSSMEGGMGLSAILYGSVSPNSPQVLRHPFPSFTQVSPANKHFLQGAPLPLISASSGKGSGPGGIWRSLGVCPGNCGVVGGCGEGPTETLRACKRGCIYFVGQDQGLTQ